MRRSCCRRGRPLARPRRPRRCWRSSPGASSPTRCPARGARAGRLPLGAHRCGAAGAHGSPGSTTRRPESCSTQRPPTCPSAPRTACCARPRATRSRCSSSPRPSAADEPSPPGSLPLTERLERAFAARVAELPEATRLVLLVAALNDDGDRERDPRGRRRRRRDGAGSRRGRAGGRRARWSTSTSAPMHFRHPLVRSAVRQAPASRSAAACTRRSPTRSRPSPTGAPGIARR